MSADPEVVYVPTYDPALVYGPPAVTISTPLIQFSVGLGVGGWLFTDCDWVHRDIYY